MACEWEGLAENRTPAPDELGGLIQQTGSQLTGTVGLSGRGREVGCGLGPGVRGRGGGGGGAGGGGGGGGRCGNQGSHRIHKTPSHTHTTPPHTTPLPATPAPSESRRKQCSTTGQRAKTGTASTRGRGLRGPAGGEGLSRALPPPHANSQESLHASPAILFAAPPARMQTLKRVLFIGRLTNFSTKAGRLTNMAG